MFYKKYKVMKETDPKRFSTEIGLLNIQGRHRNNVRALELRDRKIVPARRGRVHERNNKLVWCTLCRKALTRKAFRETHLTSCTASRTVQVNKETQALLAKNAVPVMEPDNVVMQRLLGGKDLNFKEVLYDLRVERVAITKFVLNDEVAEALLTRMASSGRGKANWVTACRLRLKCLFEIYKYFRATCGDSCRNVKEMMRYSVWHATADDGVLPRLVACCHSICGKDPFTNTFKKYNLVMMMSGVLHQTSDVLENQLHHDEKEKVKWSKEGERLARFLMSETWRIFTVRVAARQKALMVKFKKVMVKYEDFKFYLSLAEKKARKAFRQLARAWAAKDKAACTKEHKVLVETLPIAIGTFSYRRVSEPYLITLRNYRERPDLKQLGEDHDHLISEGAKQEIDRVMVIESRGKGDNAVLTVVKTEWKEALDLLSSPEFRNFLTIPEENQFLFGLRRARDSTGHAIPSRCQAAMAVECIGFVENHLDLRSRNFRMTFATNLGGMDLTYHTKKQICALMGHSLPVHERFYNIPQPIQMAAYMGFACHASAENKIKEVHDKTIESLVNLQIPNERTPDEEDV